MPRLWKGIVLVGLTLAVGAALALVLVIRHETSQLRVLEPLRSVRIAIREYHKNVGEYPDRLSDISGYYSYSENLPPLGLDPRGNALLYERRGETYVLASLGEDGRVDSTGPWEVRDRSELTSICGNNDADTVFSDLGEHQLCGK